MIPTPVVTLRALRLRRGTRMVLDGVSLEVPRGQVVALMGASGSGKTTTLRAMAGLEPFEGGQVEVDGVVLMEGAPNAPTLRQLRTKVGMVFQFHCLFEHMTARHNVWLAPVHVLGVSRADAERRAHELLQMLGVGDKAESMPHELSGGEAQRVAIARALAVQPPVLLMDEPTASLDPARRGELAATLRDIASQGRSVIVATHDGEFARACAQRVVILDGGRIRREGRPTDVLE